MSLLPKTAGRHASCAVLIALGLAFGRPAGAQSNSGGEKAAAEALFEDGRRLVAQGSFAEACPKFADSQRLDPSPGTLLNLANCWEKLGRTATAWATYREAESAASAAKRTDYLAAAERHAEALVPKLARLTVVVTKSVDGLKVKSDGVSVEPAEWGVALPVDTGTHAIEAAAPGYKTWSSSAEVPQDGAQITVTVPELEALPAPAPAAPGPPPGPAPGPPPAPPPTPGAAASSGSSQRTIGLVIGGAGIVGVGVGALFAATAKSKYSQSLSSCESGNPNLCNQTGVDERNSARSAGNVATVALAIGAAAVVTGAVVWLVSAKGTPESPASSSTLAIAPTLGGASVRGTW